MGPSDSVHAAESRKRSLFGDHHMPGPEGVRFYTKRRTRRSKRSLLGD